MGAAADRLARNARIIRLIRGLTLAEVADHMTTAGTPTGLQTVWRIEQGRRRATADDIAALATALGADVNDLLMRRVNAPDDVTFSDDPGGDS